MGRSHKMREKRGVIFISEEIINRPSRQLTNSTPTGTRKVGLNKKWTRREHNFGFLQDIKKRNATLKNFRGGGRDLKAEIKVE